MRSPDGRPKLTIQLQVEHLRVFTAFQLVTGQATDEYQAWDPTMARYLTKVQALIPRFKHLNISHIPRYENARADALSRLVTLYYRINAVPFVIMWSRDWRRRDSSERSMRTNARAALRPKLPTTIHGFRPLATCTYLQTSHATPT